MGATERFDVIVVGVGAMGSATLEALSRRGCRVLGIEQHGLGHGHGSSVGDTRLIRKAYFEHPDYVPLLERAYAGWQELEQWAGQKLLYQTGTLYIGHPEGEVIAGSRRSAREHGVAVDLLTGRELESTYPQFRCPPDYLALWEPEAGFVLCETAIRAFVDRARAQGAELRCGERVQSWAASDHQVRVATDRGEYRAAGLVLTAGSWSAGLLGTLPVTLRVTRQALFWLEPAAPEEFALGRCPCWAVQRPDRPGLFYGFPALPGALGVQPGVKLAQHAPGEPATPERPRRPAEAAELEALLESVAPLLPRLRGTLAAAKVCMYTLSADGHFVVDRHPEHARVVFGCGFSGHGFKFAPVMGEALADLVQRGRSPLPVGFLGLR